jgi:transposase-like protein
VGWWRASRTPREPTTQRTEGSSGSGGGGKAWASFRSGADERDSRLQAATVIPFLTRNVAPGSTIYTDGLKSFSGLPGAGFKHVARTQPLRSELRKGAKSAVPLADRAIGNLQQWLIGTYHGVSKAQLQVYLDEFVFRHNRRKTPAAAFQTLLGLGTGRTSTEYAQIRGAKDLNPNLLVLAEATG